jgi:hypothetical protein
MNILMSDEIRYFRPHDNKLLSLRPSDMSDPSVTLQRYTKLKKYTIIIFYICVQYDQEWCIYKLEICRSHDETNIKINLGPSNARGYKDESSVKISRKKKKYLIFFT